MPKCFVSYYEAYNLFTSDDSWFNVLVGVNVYQVVDYFMEHDHTGLCLACFRLGHSRDSNIAVTLLVQCQSDITQRADLRCTLSSLVMFSFVCGDHTVEVYSTTGLTRDLYASALVLSGQK